MYPPPPTPPPAKILSPPDDEYLLVNTAGRHFFKNLGASLMTSY